ncbi:unnamed protein product, partial [marine sediment metagenome]
GAKMPHGTPDWGLVGPKRTTYGLDDLGEHAVRLGSPHLFDRRGDVLVATDFRDGLGEVELVNVGVGGTVGLYAGRSRSGAYSVVFGGDGVNACVQTASIWVPLPVLSRVGVEFSFSFFALMGKWEVLCHWGDRNRQYEAQVRLRYTPATSDVAYWDGAYHGFGTGVTLAASRLPQHTMKMVVDLLNHEYARFIIDDLSYNLIGNFARDMGAWGVSYLWARARYTRPLL